MPSDEAADSAARSYNKAEEKALRKTKLDFGGYPAGPYYEIKVAEGLEAAYAAVRNDHPVLSDWSDAEIRATVNSIKPTASEIFLLTPIGPFFILSGVAIWRDGLTAWGIAPCKTYMDFCPPSLDLSQVFQ